MALPIIGGIGGAEWLIILAVVLLIFGPKQLPKLGKMFGKTMREVRSGMENINEELDSDAEKTDAAVDTAVKLEDTNKSE